MPGGHPACGEGPSVSCPGPWLWARGSDAGQGWPWRWPRTVVGESRQRAWAWTDTALLHRRLPSVALLLALPRLPGAAC